MLPESESNTRLTNYNEEVVDSVAVIDIPLEERNRHSLRTSTGRYTQNTNHGEGTLRASSSLPFKRSNGTLNLLDPKNLDGETSSQEMTTIMLNNNRIKPGNGYAFTNRSSPPTRKRKVIHSDLNFVSSPNFSSSPSSLNGNGNGPDSYFSFISEFADKISQGTREFVKRYLKLVLFILYNIYLVFAITKTWHKTPSYGEGVKFLTVLTGISYGFAAYYWFGKRFIVKPFYTGIICPCLSFVDEVSFLERHLSKLVWSAVIVAIVVYSVIITANNRYRLVSGCGVIGFVFFGFLMSEHRSRINWNQVLWGIFLQFSLALFVLRTTFGKQLFQCIGDKITAFLSFTDEGSSFLFGYLVTGKTNGDGIPELAAVFAFKVLPVILFFSFFVSILYFYGIMQVVVVKAGWLLQNTVGTTACESLNAAANIFLGMTEAPLIIKPYLPMMTKSELFAVMTGGFATIAGAVLAAYINFGVNATHLLSASVMAAPAALGFSKLFYPETEESKTQADNLSMEKGKEQNALEAAGNGASQAIKICSNIAGNLIAFLAFIKFLDTMCIWFGTNVDLPYVSFEWILSKLFVPIALLMGVEWEDCDKVAKMIGLKTLVNEFIAYTELTKQMELGNLSERSITISTYALCGFSNFSSIGITLGALGSLVPERKSDLASIALKAMIAGSTVTFVSASMAGLLIDVDPVIMVSDVITNVTTMNFIEEVTTVLDVVR